jgi:hypothetical protein
VISVDVLNSAVTMVFTAPQDAIYTIYETTNPNALPAPSADWTNLVDITAAAGNVTSYDISFALLPPYLNYSIIATCP